MKLYQNRTWLARKYRDHTAAEIAKMCDVSEMTIDRYLDEFGLKRNRRSWTRDR